MKTILRYCVSIALTGAFVFAAVATTRNLVFALSSNNWAVVQGLITDSRVSESRSSGRSRPQRTVYTPRVTYQYQASGQTYTASRIAFDDHTFATRQEALTFLKRFPVGGASPVYYSPSSPQNAALQPGATWTTWLFPILSVPLALALVASVVFSALGYKAPWETDRD